jgi:hypothetical protein
VWVTKGYTIENYPPSVLAASVNAVHSRTTCTWSGGLYTNPLGAAQLRGRQVVDKTAVALAVIGAWPSSNPWPLDLKQQIGQLAAAIRLANDLPAH